MMEELQEKSVNSVYKESYVIENGDHNSNWFLNPAEYFEKIREFIAKFSGNN